LEDGMTDDRPAYELTHELGCDLQQREDATERAIGELVQELGIVAHHWTQATTGACGPDFHHRRARAFIEMVERTLGLPSAVIQWPVPDSVRGGGHASVCGPDWQR
jgi:hypothetical protein